MGQTVTIGNGDILHQGLPIEPMARFSYSQQLFYGAEINHSGSISHIGFEYNVNSTGFLDGNKQLKIYMGHSTLDTLEDWVSIQSLSEVYNGILSIDYFDAGLPGNGWLMVPLQTAFSYDSAYNLIVAVDENSDATGTSADDFYTLLTGSFRALQFQSNTINPDPQNPPDNPTQKNHLSNLRLTFAGNPDAPQNLYGYHDAGINHLFWEAPGMQEIAAFRINRDGSFLAECPAAQYADSAISFGQTYSYNIRIRYQDGSISGPSNTIQITVPPEGTQHLILQGFESYAAFSSELEAWQNLDLDGSLTWAWEHTDFPHEGEAMPWMVFAPAQCSPPLTDIAPNNGHKMLMATASIIPPNNDWLISPYLHLGANANLSFYARSYTATYGLERLRVLISTTDSAPASFIPLHTEAYIGIPASWTEYSFDLSAYSDQDVYLALNCVSLDAFALFIDDILVSSEGGHLDAAQALAPSARVRNFPNPAKGSFKLEASHYFAARIYNLKGQLLHTVNGQKHFDSASLSLPAGLYLIRVQDASGSYTIKQILLP